MTGPELFREAVALAHDEPGCRCGITCCIHEQVQLQRAQVLASLALTAATMTRSGLTPADRHEWLKAMDPEYAAERAAEVTRR